MNNVDQVHTTTKALSEQMVEFLFVPNYFVLKQEIILYSSLELDQIVRASRHDSIDLYVVKNAVNNSVLLEQLKWN